MTKLFTALGLMSGTSMDGIDVSLVKTDGVKVFDLPNMPNRCYCYSDSERQIIAKALFLAPQKNHPERQHHIEQCNKLITQCHIQAVQRFLSCTRIAPTSIDVIGFHGQTILHQPEKGITLQVGDGTALAKESGIDVVFDFRSHDVQQGGQGAPLVPVFHQALIKAAPLPSPTIIVNIGGVANLTYNDPANNTLIAFDTGPGNALLDDWILEHTGHAMDKDGAIAQSGAVDNSVLQHFLSHPFFSKAGAKSLDRNDYSLQILKERGLSLEDGAATLTEFTARSIADANSLLPKAAQHWIISGGGTKNHFLMQRLSVLIDAKVSVAEDFGWNSEFMESQAFAFLAVLHMLNLPQTFPATTAAPQPLTGGMLAKH